MLLRPPVALSLWLLLPLTACDDKQPSDEDTAAPAATDADGDGFDAGADCDDTNPAIFPDAAEVCDEHDNDCDGSVDEDVSRTWFYDNDQDGYGNPDTPKQACTQPDGFVADGTDCEDLSAAVHPGAEELCDGLDGDCDGIPDDEDALDVLTGYWDGDGDGYGDAAAPQVACALDDGYVLDDTDCDDTDRATYPGAAPADSATECLRDSDGDGYGDRPSGGSDCDDADRATHPGARDTCDGIDNDCDASTGEDGTAAWFDGTTWTDMTATLQAGTPTSPARIAPTTEGTLQLCGGRWSASLALTRSTTVVALQPTTLSAARQRPVVTVSGDKLRVSLSGLTLEDGVGTTNATFSRTAGGGLQCSGVSELLVEDTVITGNSAEVGAGAFIDGCSAELVGVELSSNTADYGGGLFLFEGEAVLEDSLVIDNTASVTGGGIDVEAPGGAVLSLVDTLIAGNTAYYGGGLTAIYAAEVSCLGSSTVDAGIVGNTATYGGGALTYFGTYTTGSLLAVDCDFGTAAGKDDNAPEDVYDYDALRLYSSYGDDASFTCAPGLGCL